MLDPANLPYWEARREQHYADGFWQDDTIYSLASKHASRAPSSYAVRDSRQRLSYRQFVDAADHLAGDLAASGVQCGDRIGIWLSSRVETAIAILACARNGYVCCPSLHRNHTGAEVAALLDRTSARVLIVEQGYGADATSATFTNDLEAPTTLYKIYRLAPDTPSTDFVAANRHHNNPPRDDPDTIMYIAFTSGTSGLPKCVMHSHNTLLANARTIAADWHFDSSSVLYSISSLSHNLGFGALISAIAVGAELVIHTPKTASLLAALTETDATFIFGVPTHALDLLGEIERGDGVKLNRITGFRISGAAVPTHVVSRLLGHGITPQSGYGMTEGCSHHYTLPDDDARLITETSGRACAGYEVKIFASEDRDLEVPVGRIGEIGGRGASLMLGYFDDDTANAEAYNAAGWFMTGDLGRLDKNGYLTITGRKKDVIIRGGHNIYPARLEALAMQHDAIERAAAIAISDQRLGEKVCLVVELHAGSTAGAEEILIHLETQGLSKYDLPEYFIAVDEIPVTASGKILKRVLLGSIASGSIKPHPVRRPTSA